MKKKICVANWKMKLSLAGSLDLARQYRRLRRPSSGLDVVVCPSPLVVAPVAKLLARRGLQLGVQDIAPAAAGAYTGETSATQAVELGATYAIVGHSERRQHQQEDDHLIGRKTAAALAAGLVPIVCLGESVVEHRDGRAATAIERHVRAIFRDITIGGDDRVVVAYEPSWTISDAGERPATRREVEHSCQLLATLLIDRYGQTVFDRHLTIVYGGMVNAGTVEQFLSLASLDGFLVGSASLDIADWRALLDRITASL